MPSLFTLRYRLLALLVLALPLTLTACDSEEEEEAVSFNIASVEVDLVGGGTGLQFSAQPSVDVIVVAVTITTPTGDDIVFNAGSTTVIEGEPLALQAEDIAYLKISGTWRFEFRGSRATGSRDSFTSTATLNVGA